MKCTTRHSNSQAQRSETKNAILRTQHAHYNSPAQHEHIIGMFYLFKPASLRTVTRHPEFPSRGFPKIVLCAVSVLSSSSPTLSQLAPALGTGSK
ncbi:unnamed protein product [Penicillium roqueforti FM164]|uniref:Genomic scaffold, ProqFM164S02 n=1 Tax=Penicillium roqueforti (strain FM164) TaxID=1365484 RepID=W6Q880_PENRF|nr:unnamed protein product [Penicillium roqueforti FM164]